MCLWSRFVPIGISGRFWGLIICSIGWDSDLRDSLFAWSCSWPRCLPRISYDLTLRSHRAFTHLHDFPGAHCFDSYIRHVTAKLLCLALIMHAHALLWCKIACSYVCVWVDVRRPLVFSSPLSASIVPPSYCSLSMPPCIHLWLFLTFLSFPDLEQITRLGPRPPWFAHDAAMLVGTRIHTCMHRCPACPHHVACCLLFAVFALYPDSDSASPIVYVCIGPL